MTRDEFWSLIEAAREGTDGAEEVAENVRVALERLPPDAIAAYCEHEARLLEQSYTWPLWGAAYVANGGCSDDGFDYFRGWLLAQGRATFERTLADPDSLADLVAEQEEADCQDMICIAALAHKNVTGAYPKRALELPELGPSWDFDDAAEMRARYPRLSAKFST
jgi:hypothetical protein